MERAGWLVRAALLGLLISVVMGVGLQGRAAAAGGALNPGAATGAGPDVDVLPAQHRGVHGARAAAARATARRRRDIAMGRTPPGDRRSAGG